MNFPGRFFGLDSIFLLTTLTESITWMPAQKEHKPFVTFYMPLSERAFILAGLFGYLTLREIKSCNAGKVPYTLHAMPNLI